MFSRIFAILPLVLLVAAKAHPKARDQCSNGVLQCCQSVQSAYNEQDLLAQHDIAVADAAAQGLVGVDCTSITVAGVSKSCAASQQVACCKNDHFNGAISLGCSTINSA
ncbi:hypothetical protein V8B97DRAFT_1972741 [Scleroderma yunnanense]